MPRTGGQTVVWLDDNGIPYWDLCIVRHKIHVGADLYVEDAPHNVADLRAAGGGTIVLSELYKSHIDPPRASTWEEVEQLVLERMGRLAIETAFRTTP